MRRLYHYLTTTVLAVAAVCSLAACSDDDTTEGYAGSALELTFGDITVSSDYEANVSISAAKGVSEIFWACSLKGETPTNYVAATKEGDQAVVTTQPLNPGSYTFYAGSKNAAGKLEIYTKSFDVTLGAPSLKLGEPVFDRRGIVVPTSLVGSEEFYYAIVKGDGSQQPAVPTDYPYIVTRDMLVDGQLIIEPGRFATDGLYWIFAYTESQEFGQSEMRIFSVNYDESTLPILVELEVANITAYSFDVKVTMNSECGKYVIGGFNGTEVDAQSGYTGYVKEDFIASAKISITPDADYDYQPYNVFYSSMTVPESQLVKGTFSDDSASVGMRVMYENEEGRCYYRVAVYAEDMDGNGTVYTSDAFTVPAPAFSENPTVGIDAFVTTSRITPTFTPSGACAKVVYGHVDPDYYTDVNWNDPTATEEFISSIIPDGSVNYDGYTPITVPIDVDFPTNHDVIVYAIPVTADGKLGKLCYDTITTLGIQTPGVGSANLFLIKSELWSFSLSVTLFDAVSARIWMASPSERSMYPTDEDKLEEFIRTSENSSGLRYKEVTAAELSASYGLYKMACVDDVDYAFWVVTIDKDGKMSPVQIFDNNGQYYHSVAQSTDPGPGSGDEIDFSKGTGEATINVLKTEDLAGDGTNVKATYTVTLGANTVEAYTCVTTSGGMLISVADVTENVTTTFKDVTDGTFATYKIVTEGTQYVNPNGVYDYDPNYGGDAIVVVTKDASGNYKLFSQFIKL